MRATTTRAMFRAIGAVIVLWYLSHLFTQSFASLDSALSATLETVEAGAIRARTQLE